MTDAITEQSQDKIDAAVSGAAHAFCETCDDFAKPYAVEVHITSGHETVLDEAAAVTSGPRERDYDHPLPNHQRIVDGWRWYIKAKYGIEVPFVPEDGPNMMGLLKMTRDMHRTQRDNLVDICGYARCIERMRAKRGEEGYAP